MVSTNSIISYDEFLGLFPSQPRRRHKQGCYVRCPAHADNEPSLLVEPSTNPDFSVSFKCFAGCQNEAILKSVNLTWDHIRINHNGHKPQSKPHGEIEAVYKYERGAKLVFEVVRTNPKGFFQRRPDGKGGYVNNLEGVETFLYHYDHIKGWISGGATIFLPEGEKDAESLIERGCLATTNPGGAGKWKDSYTETLRGGNVVVLQDNDKPGKEFALQKLTALYGKVRSLKLIELPGASETLKDITDWLTIGDHSVDELQELICHSPEWTPDYEITRHLVNLSDVQVKEIRWLAKPYIPLGYVTMLEGDPGDGKSTVALAIAAGVTKGARIPWATFPAGKVLIMSAEDGLADIIKPRLLKMEADCDKIVALDELLTLDETGVDKLEKYIRLVQPILVAIDPIIAFTDREMDLHKANQVRWLMARLAKIAETYGLAIIVIRHLTKSVNTNALYRGNGSIDFAASVRSILLSGTNDTGEKALIHTKCNLAPKGESIGFKLIDFGLQWTGKSDMTYKDTSSENAGALDEAKAWLEQTLQEGPKESNLIFAEADKLHVSRGTLNRARTSLGVVCYNVATKGVKGAGKWFWKLKTDKSQPPGESG